MLPNTGASQLRCYTGHLVLADACIEVLAKLCVVRGVPQHTRGDNGREFIAAAIRRWLSHAEVQTLYIEPSDRWEHPCEGSFHSQPRVSLWLGRSSPI